MTISEVERRLGAYLGRDCLIVGHGNTAIYLALRAIRREVGLGEVILPAMGCVSIGQNVLYAGMKPVFADAFYFVALVNRADQHHSKAVAAAQNLRTTTVTTEWVLAEFADALAGSTSRRLVRRFVQDLEQDSKVRIIKASTELFHRGLQIYEERLDKEWSLTDCISFIVMGEENLAEALTGDKHFEQAGFIPLLK